MKLLLLVLLPISFEIFVFVIKLHNEHLPQDLIVLQVATSLDSYLKFSEQKPLRMRLKKCFFEHICFPLMHFLD